MIGKTISHYKITAELGRGGMGVVYEAEHTRLKQPVALKFLPKELTGDKSAKTRFTHEAQAASSLKHHHVCTIHDIDETDDGRLFICMDLYEGGSLKDLVDQGPMEVDRAIDLATQVADGLSAAHDAGIVHRDIKPANILLTKTGEAMIADFGLAKLTDRTRVTKTGTTIGTAAYMSPEQTQGHEVDKPSDVWSLGVMLYQMLTGEFPFQGDHDVALTYGIVNTDPVPLSVHRAEIPEGVQAIIDRCLAKNPSDRYPSAAEVRDELKTLRADISHGSDSGRRTGSISEASPGFGSGRRILALAGAVVAIVAAAFVFHLNRSGEPTPVSASEMAIAIVDFQDLSGGDDPTLSAGITSLVNVGLIENSPIRVVSTSYLHELRRRLFENAEGIISKDQAMEVARKSGASVALIGEVSITGDDQLVMWQLVDTRSGQALGAKTVRGADVLVCADAVVSEVVPFLNRISPDMEQPSITSVRDVSAESPEAYKHYIAGVLHYEGNEAAAARREFEQAVAIDTSFAQAYLYLSKTHYGVTAGQTGDNSAALRYADTAWRHRSNLDSKERLRLEARRHWVAGRNLQAYEIYDQILERWPDDREVLEDYSSELYFRWSFEKSVMIAVKGLQLYPKSELLLTLGYAGFNAIKQSERGLELARLATARFPESPNNWDNLGLAFISTGQPDSAQFAFERALSIDSDFLYSLAGLAHLSCCRGDIVHAIELTQSLLSRTDLNVIDRVDFLLGYGEFGLATYYAEQGQCRKSLELVGDATRYEGRNQTVMKRIAYPKCRFLMRMGRDQEALEFASAFRDSLTDDWRKWEFEWFRARSHIEMGNLEAAAETVRFIEEVGIGQKIRVFAVGITAELELAEGRAAESIDTFLEFKRRGGWAQRWEELEGRTNLARAYHMAGRSDEAIAELNELIRIYKGHALGHYELGKIYEDLGRTAEARDEYTTFLEMWSEADEDMPQLIDARARLNGLPKS